MTVPRTPRQVPSWLQSLAATAVLLGLVTYATGRLSLDYFKVVGEPTPLWWPMAALALVVVMRCPARWRYLLIAVFGVATVAANLPYGTWIAAIIFAIVNVLEVSVAAVILSGSDPSEPRLRTAQEAIRFAVAVAVAVTIGAALVGARGLLFPGDVVWYHAAISYAASHALGMMAVAPLLLPRIARDPASVRHRVEFAAVLVITALLCWWIFLDASVTGRAFPVLLPVVWVALRLDVLRATVTSLLVCATAAYATSRSLGTMADLPEVHQRLLVTQMLIATVSLCTLVLVLITRHRARLADQATDSEETLQIAIRNALVGIYSIRLDPDHLGELSQVNLSICQMLGYEADQLLGRNSRMFLPHTPGNSEFEAIRKRTLELADGQIDAFQRETVFVTSTGEELWVELSASRVTPRTAPPFALVYVHDLTGREETKKLLESMALQDTLTGLPNRAVVFPRLDELLHRARRDDTMVGLLYLDLNGFKPVNDTFGHAAGDAVLIEVARRLQRVVRIGDTAARLGGDEFAVIAADISDTDELDEIADAIRESLTCPIVLPEGGEVTIDTSIGVAIGRGAMTADELISAADAAMYREKNAVHAAAAELAGTGSVEDVRC